MKCHLLKIWINMSEILMALKSISYQFGILLCKGFYM